MALPSVMVKIVCSVGGGSRTVADRTERAPHVHGRHVPFKRESQRRDIASCAMTPNHMIACGASSTQVRGMRRHVIPRCGCTLPCTQDTAGTTLWLNRDAMRQKNWPRSHSSEGLWLRSCAVVRQSVGSVKWLPSFVFAAHISQGEWHHHLDARPLQRDR